MALPTVKLKPQHPDRIGHPWIFDNEIGVGPDAKSGFENGGIVRILDSRNKAIGVGYLNAKSKIAVRYLSRRGDLAVNDGFWKSRIATAYRYRQARYAADGKLPTAYRLIHGESDGLPGLVVDVYGDFATVQFLALGLEPWREAIIGALMDTVGLKGLYERSDSSVRKLEGLEERTGVLRGETPPDLLELEDHDATLLVDVKNGAKTGLFLDQRENQIAAAREAVGRNVLNCFSYTGLFSLRAAYSGAASVTDVEASPIFNELNKKQWERNGKTIPHSVVTDNVFDYLRALEKQNYQTDMIILDPPAFTKNRASREGAARGYNEINRVAMGLLKQGGVLVTCSCSHHLNATEFRDIVHSAATDAGRSLTLITQRGQPPDHPVLLNAPESEYLKCLILSV